MLINLSAVSVSVALFISVAVPQAQSWLIVNGLDLQPTQQQVDSRIDDRVRQWSRGVQSEIDRLYGEIMRGPR